MRMRTLTITLAAITAATFVAAPVAEMVLTQDLISDISFQTGPQAGLVYRCQKYNVAWPCSHSDSITMPGAMMIMAYHSVGYDPRWKVQQREFVNLIDSDRPDPDHL